jgi:hypothetical protein
MLWEKQGVEKLRLPKAKVSKRTMVVDLRKTHGRVFSISRKVIPEEKGSVEQELPKAGEPEFIGVVRC